MKLNFPPATAVAKTEDPFRPDAEVDLIDGNHRHHVMLQLQELYPEIMNLKQGKNDLKLLYLFKTKQI